MLSQEVEKVVKLALDMAHEKRQEFATVEHLCVALFDCPRIRSLLSQLGVNKQDLTQRFFDFIDNQIEALPLDRNLKTLPSLGFQRVLQRAAVHIIGAGREEVLAEHVLVAAFEEDESHAVFIMQEAGLTRLDLVSVISHTSPDEEGDGDGAVDEFTDDSQQKQSVLERYSLCLTEEARKGHLDKLIGRGRELERTMQVLSRRRKNNPLFVGEPGVGKTALAEGLAIKIIERDVPDYLLDSEVYLLDMGAMLAGARFRGDFEARMKSVLNAIIKQKNAIMVIDEIHTIIGAGATASGSMDASNLLKPILAKGNVRCIGLTTFKEYRTYFEKDRALARRFQKIDIDEPSDEECMAILSGMKGRYEEHHGVSITDDAVLLSVSLSKRFLHDKKLPDKALDLLDEACAGLRLKKGQGKLEGDMVIDGKAIEDTLATMAQIPARQVSANDQEVLSHLKKTLSDAVFGQEIAIEQLTNAILLSRAGLRERDKPIGSFLFSGPSGVGKTEVAKQLALALGISFVRFDMSEYMERHSASRLVGAPPGYVGFDQGGLLTEAITKTPYAVLLLDEIEKAHPDVFNMLLQVMDYGKLTDGNGRVADFRHVILIMTSNAGARELEERPIGFTGTQNTRKDDKAIQRLFSPEFRNRLDASVRFNKLSEAVIIQVVDKFISELQAQLKDKQVNIVTSDDAKVLLAQLGYDQTMGARPLSRIIQDQIKKPIAHELLFGRLKNGGKVNISVANGAIQIAYS